jgi:hypothetical protein
MFKLWKLKRRRDKLQRAYDKDRAALVARKADREELDAHDSEESHFMDEEYDAIEIFQSDKLLEQGTKYDVRMPSRTDPEYWVLATPFDRAYLTSAGRNQVRRLIDEEKTRRFEAKTLWVTKIILPLAGVLVGLIGAATGFIAVWRHAK